MSQCSGFRGGSKAPGRAVGGGSGPEARRQASRPGARPPHAGRARVPSRPGPVGAAPGAGDACADSGFRRLAFQLPIMLAVSAHSGQDGVGDDPGFLGKLREVGGIASRINVHELCPRLHV